LIYVAWQHGQNCATVGFHASLSASFQILGSSDELASCQRGVPTPCELKAALGVPTAGKQLETMCLILRASQHAIALLRGGKIIKQLGLGIIVALGLTLPGVPGVIPL
jgi:hypothetical protein